MQKSPLILLPGLLSDETVWHHQVNYLKDIVNCIIPNLSSSSTASQMVKTILDIAPPSFAIAGHSMGGWVALEVTKLIPERIKKLCLINTTAKLDTKEKKAKREEMIKLAKSGKYEVIINNLLKAYVYRKEFIGLVGAMFQRNKNSFINHETAMLNRESCIPILKKIKCPTLIIHAKNDAVFGINHSILLANKIPSSKLKIIEDSGHMSPIEAASEVTALMREWLTQC